MSIEKKLIALLSSMASEFSNTFIHINSVMHKSGTKYMYIQIICGFKRDKIGGTQSLSSFKT